MHFGTYREPTKVRVNGVVDASVTRPEFTSAPGEPPREIPLVEMFPGQRTFSSRLTNITAGRLVAYGPDGKVLAAFTNSLNPCPDTNALCVASGASSGEPHGGHL